jgi:DNA ligase-1
MLFSAFTDLCERLEGISGRLEMVGVLAGVLAGLPDDELPVCTRFIMGRVFPDWSPEKLGIGPNQLFDAIAYVAGKKRADVVSELSATGDIGLTAEKCVASKVQTSFFTGELGLLEVNGDLSRVAAVSGKASQREKGLLLRRLFSDASPREARYLARLVMGDMRIGIGEGNVRDAIIRAFSVDQALVEHAYQALNDLGEVALLARKGDEALREVRIRIFHPVKAMLAQQGSIQGTVNENGELAAEIKYDGSRFQFHKEGERCRIYSRKLEDVTSAMPDVVRLLSGATRHDVIVDGEVIAVREGRPLPFQTVLRRFRRKYDIDEMKEEVQLVPAVFDILYLDGQTLIDLPVTARRKLLVESFSGFVAPQLVSGEPGEIERFYQQALDGGHEGIMLKVLPSAYTPGVRGKNWLKVKPEVDTLDLAVVGADWGEGKRAHVFGSFHLACRSDGDFITISRVATGFSDEQLALLYDLLKDTVTGESGKEVRFEPTLVFEIGYAEIQKSPNYETGYALRFPRFIRVRDDKDPRDADTLGAVLSRYEYSEKKRMNGSGQVSGP